MALTNVKKGRTSKKRFTRKINLVFDETKRREFLTGFRKRKLQRKKQAQETLEKELKEERKRLKAEAKESYKKLVVSHRDIPELEKYLPSNEYEEDDVTVKVVELSANVIARQSNWIGANQPRYEESDDEQNEGNTKSDCEDAEEVPGMELKRKPPVKTEKKNLKKFQSEKQVKKELKKQATKNVQKSKVFQKKNKLEQQKQKKKSIKVKRQRETSKFKSGKKGSVRSKNNKKTIS